MNWKYIMQNLSHTHHLQRNKQDLACRDGYVETKRKPPHAHAEFVSDSLRLPLGGTPSQRYFHPLHAHAEFVTHIKARNSSQTFKSFGGNKTETATCTDRPVQIR